MQSAFRWLGKGAEAVAAAMLAAMFLTFVLQILARYVLPGAFNWTVELCLTLWVWIVFWGNAFIVKDRDHVTFDLVYLMAPTRVRRVLALITAAAIAVGFAVSLLPTWDYIDFLKIKKSATLQIPLRTVFSIYAFFLIVVVLRYVYEFVRILRLGPPDEAHVIHVGEE